MHAKNFATTHSQFAAQAEIEKSTKATTRKSWRKASKTGLNQWVRVGVLGCVCMLLLCLNGACIYAICQYRLQRTGNFSGEQAAQICHQGRKAQQTTATVSKIKTYSKCNFFSNTKLKINIHTQSEGVTREALCNEKFLSIRHQNAKKQARNPHRYVA